MLNQNKKRTAYQEAELEADTGRIVELLRSHFGIVKTIMWMNSKIPLLGNIKPIDMVKLGRTKKLLKFVKETIEENKLN